MFEFSFLRIVWFRISPEKEMDYFSYLLKDGPNVLEICTQLRPGLNPFRAGSNREFG